MGPQEITLDLTSRTSQLRTSSVDMLLLILRISQLVVVLTSQHRSLFLTTPVKFAMVILLFRIATLLTSLANLTKSRRRLIDVLVNQLKATPKFIKSGDAGIVELIPSKPMCVE